MNRFAGLSSAALALIVIVQTSTQVFGQAGPAPEVAALTERVRKLEARIAADDQAAGAGAQGKVAGTVIKAPFKVVDTKGQVVMSVEVGDENTLTIHGKGAEASLSAGDFARFETRAAGNVAQLESSARGSLAYLGLGEDDAVLLSADSSVFGLEAQHGRKPVMQVAALPKQNRKMALRFYDANSRQVVSAGENPATPGTGLVSVGNGSRNGAALAANADSSGIVHAFAADGTVGSGLIGVDRMVAAYNKSGAAVVTIGKSENSEGGNVTSRDPTGDGVFRAGFNSAVGGGDACVFRAKKQQTYCLGLGVPGVGVVGR